MGINKWIGIGNLGGDPEVVYQKEDLTICSFSLATSKTHYNKELGTKETKTTWHKIKAFGKLAEICVEFLTKGKQVYVEGEIEYPEWEDNDGNKRKSVEIVIHTMQMLGTRDDKPKHGPADDEDVPF